MVGAVDLSDPKYASVQCERRFLVRADAAWRDVIQPYSKRFEDKYLTGTRLRLRVQTDSDTGRVVLKLNRMFESPSPYYRTVNRILLTPGEHRILDGLEGVRINKVRHYHIWRDQVFSVNVFEGELEGLVLCEIESTSVEEVMDATPPPYVAREVTEDPFFTGVSLCRASRDDLKRALSAGNGRAGNGSAGL